MSRIMTKHYSSLLDSKQCDIWYTTLRDSIKWQESIKSKKGFTGTCDQKIMDAVKKRKGLTRLACPFNFGENKIIDNILIQTCEKLKIDINSIYGIYVNYYKNGIMWTPSHSHPNSKQLIISLGTTRTLKVGTRNYEMNNGDAIIFGSSQHQVPPSDSEKGRISIACFIAKEDNSLKSDTFSCVITEDQLISLITELSIQDK